MTTLLAKQSVLCIPGLCANQRDDTQTGQVGGEWGATGAINLSDRFYIPNWRLYGGSGA